MQKKTITTNFGLVGAFLCPATSILRDWSINNPTINYILGVMPNLAATWLCIWLIELIFNKEKLFTMKQAICSSGIVFTLALIFEIVSNIYNGIPFDINDIIATIIAITIYLVTLYFKRNSVIEE